MMKRFPALMAIAAVILLPCLAGGAPLLDDHFDNDDLATNTNGTGTGFTAFVAGGSVTETMSEAVFNLTLGGLHSLYSNDNLNLFTSAGTTTKIQVSGSFTDGNIPMDFPAGENSRIWFGLVTETTNTGSYALPLDSTPGRHGLWVSLYDSIDGDPFNQATLGPGTNPNNYNGQLGWVDPTGNRTILAQFTYDTYLGHDPAHNVIDVIMTVTDTTYAVSFGGPDAGVTVQNGLLSGSLPSAASGNFKVAATIQSGGPAAASGLDIDRITVNPAASPLQPGDFDGDGDVDGADFVAWQTNFPKAAGALLSEGDADGDGDVDGADFVVWQTNFPFTPGPGAAPVPEPQTLTLFAIAGFLAFAARRGRRCSLK